MVEKTKQEETNIFDEEEIEDVVEHDDLKEGFVAESDPSSKVKHSADAYKQEAEDLLAKSLNQQVTALGRKTAEKLKDEKKIKLMVPKNELMPDDEFVVVGINGWVTQIRRGEPVMVPESFFEHLSNGGYNPTIVP